MSTNAENQQPQDHEATKSPAADSKSPVRSKKATSTNFMKKIMKSFHKKDSIKPPSLDHHIKVPKDPNIIFQMVLNLLIAYKELDTKQVNKKNVKKSSKDKEHDALLSMIHDIVIESEPPLARADFSFVFHLLNLSLTELHNAYQDYYTQFDSDRSLKIEEPEFEVLLDYLCHSENMGKAKVKKSFEIYSPDDFRYYNKLALINPTGDNELEPSLKKNMFAALAVQNSRANDIGSKRYIHYLKFFPLIFSYFSEFLKQKIKNRVRNIELIAGLTEVEKRRISHHTHSFLNKLEQLGCKYEDDEYPTEVSYSVLERAVILFRNSYSDVFGQDQMKLLLKELQEKCNLNHASEREDRKVKLKYKFLRWIAYRICLHCALSKIATESKAQGKVPPHYKILEEYTLWAAAYSENKFNRDWIKNKFKKSLLKTLNGRELSNIRSEETKTITITVLKEFCRKLMPHMKSEVIEKIYELFCEKMMKEKRDDVVEALPDWLYNLIMEVAGLRLRELITKIYETMNPDKRKQTQHPEESKSKPVSRVLSPINLLSPKDASMIDNKSVDGSMMRNTPENTPKAGGTFIGGGNTPKGGGYTPKGGSNTPKGGASTPKGGGNTPRGGRNTPKGGGNTPRESNTPKGNTPKGNSTPAVGDASKADKKGKGTLKRPRKGSFFTSLTNLDALPAPSSSSGESDFLALSISPSPSQSRSDTSIENRTPKSRTSRVHSSKLDFTSAAARFSRTQNNLDRSQTNLDQSYQDRSQSYLDAGRSLKTEEELDQQQQPTDKFYNKHTKRKVDVVNSYFILESFLERASEIRKNKKPEQATEPQSTQTLPSSHRKLTNSMAANPFYTRKNRFSAVENVLRNVSASPRASTGNQGSQGFLSVVNRATMSHNRELSNISVTEHDRSFRKSICNITPRANFIMGSDFKIWFENSQPEGDQNRLHKRKRTPEESSGDDSDSSSSEEERFTGIIKNYNLKESEMLLFRKQELMKKRDGYCCGGNQSCSIF